MISSSTDVQATNYPGENGVSASPISLDSSPEEATLP